MSKLPGQSRDDSDSPDDLFAGRVPGEVSQPSGSKPEPIVVTPPASPPQTPSFPFDEGTAKAYQRESAEHLGKPVEMTNGIGMKLALIPPGEFLMGSPEGEEGRRHDETLHRVKLTRPFYLGVHQVTQGHYEAVMGANPSEFKGADRPVEEVSWQDAAAFCKKLSEREGREYRLPTEAEWEWACRAGTATPFWFGQRISTEQANYDGNRVYGNGKKGKDRQKTTPVGSFPANHWGLHDMHGNVCEWCLDAYRDYPTGLVEDPYIQNGLPHVLRGGSWLDYPWFCRSAIRDRVMPGLTYGNCGFRVVCVIRPGLE